MFINYNLLYTLFLQAIPGQKLIEKGLETSANSLHQEMNTVLVTILIGVIILAGIIVKYIIKEKKESLIRQGESFVKEQAINEGAHQQVVSAKDQHIKSLTDENTLLKKRFEEIVEDNTEVYKQLTAKINSFVEGQAVIAAMAENHNSKILLEINRAMNK
jgi:predicted metal-dependent hydrolase